MRPITTIAVVIIMLAFIVGLLIRQNSLTMDTDFGLSFKPPGGRVQNEATGNKIITDATSRSETPSQKSTEVSRSDDDVLTIVIDKQTRSGQSNE